MYICVETAGDLAGPGADAVYVTYEDLSDRGESVTDSAGVSADQSSTSYVDFATSNQDTVEQAADDLGLLDRPDTGNYTIAVDPGEWGGGLVLIDTSQQ